MIKYQHSLHTLPYVYMGAFLAEKTIPPLSKLGWITLGMISARALAMGLNRYIDREIDCLNPRTSERALPKKQLSPKECLIFCAVALVLCLLAASQLTPLIWLFSPLFLTLFIFYPFTKRFTWSCHLWLGVALGLAPFGGWIAITNEISWPPVLMALAVFSLIAGSDIVYTCQDIEVDRSQGLNSIPAVFGVERAIFLTKAFHAAAAAALVGAGMLLELNYIFYFGLVIAASFVVLQDNRLSASDMTKASNIFLANNVFVSLVILLFSILSIKIS